MKNKSYDVSNLITMLYVIGNIINKDNDGNIMTYTIDFTLENYSFYLAQGYSQDYINANPNIFKSANTITLDGKNTDEIVRKAKEYLKKYSQPIITEEE